MKPGLSICCITYNQEKYIGKTLEGFFEQKTNFDIEIILCDDASTDNTSSIVQEYAEKYPGKLKYFRQVNNIGMMPNFLYALKACTGEYIALCEGDDYWTDDQKLQKQVDFLQGHSEYVGSFHNTEECYEEDQLKASFLYCDFPEARDITFKDLSYKNHIPTCSVVFKNGLFDSFPAWYETLPVGDWPLHLLHAQYGNFWYIPKIMAVHRLHTKSVWMLQDIKVNVKHIKNVYDTLIQEFSFNPSLQQQLIVGKDAFLKLYEPAIEIEGTSKNSNQFSFKVTFKKVIKNILPYFLVSSYQKARNQLMKK